MTKFLPLFLLFFVSCVHPPHATILYFNDAHEISPVKDTLGERGGIARLKSIVDYVKKENPHTLVIFGGDLAGGTLFGGVYHGFPIVEAFNNIPIDIANFGQHDFDFGVENARRLVDSSKFEWLTSNLLESDGSTFHKLPSILIKKCGGISIAFIGLTDAMNTTTSNDIIQRDLIEAAMSSLLKIENVDVIIAITQTDLSTNEALLLTCPQIDVVLAEERSENRTKIDYVGRRPVISPCGNIGSVVRLDIEKWKDHMSMKTSVLPVDSTVIEHPKLLALQNACQNDLEKKLSDVIALSEFPLDAGINSDFRCRWAETTIGNLVTDAFRAFYRADVAVINGGGLRANIDVGKITSKELLAVLPFNNKVCLVEMTGSMILNMLEHGVSDVENRGGQFLQISGGRYAYDWHAQPGERITDVFIKGEKINLDKNYKVALPDYVLLGGNDFKIADSASILVGPDEAPQDVVVVRDFILDDSLSYTLEGRITVLYRN